MMIFSITVCSLLVIGMEHYGSVSAWDLIQQNLMPIKTPKQVEKQTPALWLVTS